MGGINFNFSLHEDLSSIGDSLTNFIYSLALSNAQGIPVGKKLSNSTLARALKEAGLREKAGTRASFHRLGNCAEHIIFLGWAEGRITIEESVEILEEGLDREGSEVKAFASLLREIAAREKF